MNMIKRVVAVNGSPRKTSTHKVLMELADLLEAQQIQVTILDLADFQIGGCIGCELCIRKTSQCFQKDNAQEILTQMQSADGIILASPVYVMNITGRLKSLIDKTASWIHRPPMAGKPVLSLATTAGAGLKDVQSYLDKVAVQWGMHPTDKIGRTVMNKTPLSLDEVSNFLWHLNNPPDAYTPSLNQVMQFQVQKVLAMKVVAIDRAYWSARGWDKQQYYYACRLSLGKRLIAWGFYKLLDFRIRPSDPIKFYIEGNRI
ncbi:MAG: NAD(P)H-dependent oxidoreductase [Anaerolineaceae bacterium]|nr:NAD(P)H-dependent oxidoreductase [Anaerolineaceae bacterium]